MKTIEYYVDGKERTHNVWGDWKPENVWKWAKSRNLDMSQLYFQGVKVEEPPKEKIVRDTDRTYMAPKRPPKDHSWKENPRECRVCGELKEAKDFVKHNPRLCKVCDSKRANESHKKRKARSQ